MTVDELISSNLHVVTAISKIRKSRGGMATTDELYSWGLVGLWEAAKKFDPSIGVPFSAFCQKRVHGAILDSLRTESFLSRRQRDNGATCDLQYWRDEEFSVGVEDRHEDRLSAQDCVSNGVRNLTDRERAVLYLRFFNEMTLVEIGVCFGLDFSTVSLIVKHALAKVRKEIE